MWIPVFWSLLPVLDLPHGEERSCVKLEFSMCQLESYPPSEVWLHLPFTLQAAARSLLCLLLSRLTSILSLSLPTMCSSSLEPSLESFLVLGSPNWNSSSLPVHLGAFFFEGGWFSLGFAFQRSPSEHFGKHRWTVCALPRPCCLPTASLLTAGQEGKVL